MEAGCLALYLYISIYIYMYILFDYSNDEQDNRPQSISCN